MSSTSGTGPEVGAAVVAADLLGSPVEAVDRVVGHGRNSRVYAVVTRGRRFALKVYPPPRGDHDQMSAEVEGLRFMQEIGLECVPRVVETDVERRAAVLTWLDGSAPIVPSAADVDQALAFLAAVHAARAETRAGQLGLAGEACLSGKELLRQVHQRLEQLLALHDEPQLHEHLNGYVLPVLPELEARVVSWKGRFSTSQEALPFGHRTLSPSDFGFHNALRDASGHLAFIDFEHFGWDDPVKLVSDVLLHPGHELSAVHRRHLLVKLSAQYSQSDPDFSERLDAYLPMFAIRWVLILLNEFLPDRWAQRRAAGADESWGAVKSRQLRRARLFSEQLRVLRATMDEAGDDA